MVPEEIERRLAAILNADVVGYSRLMAEDEVGTVRALRACRESIRERVEHHRGRVVDSPGDNLLVELPSALAAVRCAVEIQRKLRHRNRSLDPNRRMEFRIGIHVGDVLVEGERIYGDGVNITARLEGLAEGGGICISAVVYEQVRRKVKLPYEDLGPRRVKNFPEPLRAYRVRLGSEAAEPRTQRELGPPPDHIPALTTPFVGRRAELAGLLSLLEDPYSRLVTLVGPGGIGKTRLALEVARELVGHFTHGVHFVPLAPLSSPDFLVSTVAGALKYSFSKAGDEKSQLLGYLRERELLLVIDNFEHLLAGADLVGEILDTAPRARVLATSRERLNTSAETVYELPGLTLPGDEQAPSFESCEAVELFVTYARRGDAHYTLSESDKPAVARICRLTDGMPLALELAASWIRTLSAAEIADELARDLGFLETTMRGVPERHRSMRAVFEYSWNRMTEHEQAVFRKLSVFRGGFTSDVARLVSGASMRALATLVDKSLIVRAAAGRFSIHELLRQYAGERLEAAPDEAAAARAAHGACYAEFLRDRHDDLSKERQLVVAGEIDVEIENLRAAWEWTLDRAGHPEIGEMTVGLAEYFSLRHRQHEGEETFRRAAAQLERRPASKGGALGRVLARQALFEPRLETGRELLELGLAAAQELGDRSEIAFCLRGLGGALSNLGEVAQGRGLVEESVSLYRELGDKSGEARALRTLGFIHGRLGERDEALRCTEESLAAAREIGDLYRMAVALQNLGGWSFAAGRIAEARPQFEEAIALWREIGNPAGVAFSLAALCGGSFYWEGKVEESSEMIEESVELAAQAGFGGGTNLSLVNMARLEILRENYASAGQRSEQALAVGHATGNYMTIMFANESLGSALLGQGDVDGARPYLRRALELALQLSIVPAIPMFLAWMALVRARDGEPEAAAELLASALGDAACPHWIERGLPLIAQLGDQLREELTPGALTAAQERGRERGVRDLAARVLGEQ